MRRYQSWSDWPAAHAALAGRLTPAVVVRLSEAYRFAAEWHGDQVRPGGEPYVEHLLEALEVLFDSGAGETGPGAVPLVAALLHDVVEDTPCTIEDVGYRFGPEVAEQVAWLTRPPAGPADAEAVRDRYLARFAEAPTPVLAVKLSDRYSNVQRLHTHPCLDKQRGYYRETVDRFLSLAARIPFFQELFTEWAQEYAYLSAR
ncbi:MAG TPA: HD domain-containing protein [Mycobacteriales bacterium]